MMVVTPSDVFVIVRLRKRNAMTEEFQAVQDELNLWGITSDEIQQVFASNLESDVTTLWVDHQGGGAADPSASQVPDACRMPRGSSAHH
eukprot:4479249-Pyramimonas_sp.AAC.1